MKNGKSVRLSSPKSKRKQKACAQRASPPPDKVADQLAVQLQRPQNVAEGILVVAILILRADGNHVEQLTVAELRRDDCDQLSLARCLIDITETSREPGAATN